MTTIAPTIDKRKFNKPAPVTARHPAPTVSVVSMDVVPPPPPRAGSCAEDLYTKIGDLKAGQALKAVFGSPKHGDYVRGKLRSMAKKDKQFMSSSSTPDGLTRWFWLEKL